MRTRTIEVVDYDPNWSYEFAELKRVIGTQLGHLALSIEHVGSTSVPGLAAKPIIDLDIVIESNVLLPDVIQSLAELGYVHEGDLGIPEREAFGYKGNNVPRDGTGRTWQTHHLYVCPQDSKALARHIVFRDYLRNNSDTASAYGKLKSDLAQKFPHDIDSYLKGKEAFIDTVVARALG